METLYFDKKKTLMKQLSLILILIQITCAGCSDKIKKTDFRFTSLTEKENQVELPFHFHAGESASIQNKNIKSTLPLNSKRLGHGLNLTLFPEEMEEIIAQNVLVVINPWSNKILDYVADLRNHPAREFLANDLICSTSSDDPGVFDSG